MARIPQRRKAMAPATYYAFVTVGVPESRKIRAHGLNSGAKRCLRPDIIVHKASTEPSPSGEPQRRQKMPNLPDRQSLEALRAFDTPTICNALEIVAPGRRAYGFNRRPLVAPFPELKPVVGFARTALIRSREPHPRDRDSATKLRLGYYEHIPAEPLPSISVIQELGRSE